MSTQQSQEFGKWSRERRVHTALWCEVSAAKSDLVQISRGFPEKHGVKASVFFPSVRRS